MRRKSSTFWLVMLSSALLMAISGQSQAQTSKTDMISLADGTTVVGKARLRRSDAGAKVTIRSTGLVAGDAYSVWWLIFNEDPNDDSVMNATGRIADSEGNATFNAFLPVGFIHTEPASGNLRQLFGPGLQNVRKAEIGVVVRTHGPSTGDIEQVSTFLGDCDVNICDDVQIAFFPMPHRDDDDDSDSDSDSDSD